MNVVKMAVFSFCVASRQYISHSICFDEYFHLIYIYLYLLTSAICNFYDVINLYDVIFLMN